MSRVVRSDVVRFAQAHGIADDDLTSFLTAIGEALANAIEHARAQAEIEVEIVLASPRTPSAAAGCRIMRRCSDIFALHSVPGCGTAVTVGRLLRAKRPARTSLDPSGPAVARLTRRSVAW